MSRFVCLRTSLARLVTLSAGVLTMAAIASGCGKVPEPSGDAAPAAKPAPSPKASGAAGNAGAAASAGGAPVAASAGAKLTWVDPAAWRRRPPSSPMRTAEYGVPGAEGEAECTVSTFGAGQGGTVEANIDRWVRQFEPDDASKAERTTREVGPLRVTIVELAGTFRGMTMPGAEPAATKKQQRMRGAIVETSSGPWFIKLTGPDATVKAARADFDALVGSLKQAG